MEPDSGRLVLTALGAELEIDPAAGGRIAALRVDGLDLVVPAADDPLRWGIYPMVPWAGRLGEGRLPFRGTVHQLPLTMPPHAIHGTAWDAPWHLVETSGAEATLAIELGLPWPFGGRAIERITLEPDGLRATLELHASERPMPATLGWHPWFARRLARGAEAVVEFEAAAMLRKGADDLPTGERVAPAPGPWDDAFVGLDGPPLVRWPDAIELAVLADVPCWVVYTAWPSGICVEPQTGPPNGLATGECAIVERGHPLVMSMTLAWRRLAPAG